MFYFQDEIEIDDINKMNYDDFIKHETILYVKTNLSKKQLQSFRRKIKDNSFYPVHIIRDNLNDTEQMKQYKLQHLQKENEELFKKRYLQIAKDQFGVKSLFEIKDKIEKCPFCNHEKVGISHNYSQEYTNCTLLVKCDSCNQVLDMEQFITTLDSDYAYSKNIHNRLDLYCKNYGNKFIKQKIFDELKNTEIICHLSQVIM